MLTEKSHPLLYIFCMFHKRGDLPVLCTFLILICFCILLPLRFYMFFVALKKDDVLRKKETMIAIFVNVG